MATVFDDPRKSLLNGYEVVASVLDVMVVELNKM